MAVEERIKGEDKHMIDEIVSRMHGYVIRDEHIPWRFVDREAEVWNMVDEEGVVEGGWITVLYGPKDVVRALYLVLSDIPLQSLSGRVLKAAMSSSMSLQSPGFLGMCLGHIALRIFGGCLQKQYRASEVL